MKGLVLALVVLLAGCGSAPKPEPAMPTSGIYSVRPPMVEKVRVERPVLEIHKLTDPTPAQVAKAYAATVQQLIGYAEALERVLEQLQQEYTVFDADPFFNF